MCNYLHGNPIMVKIILALHSKATLDLDSPCVFYICSYNLVFYLAIMGPLGPTEI